MSHQVMDFETLVNLTMVVFEDYKTEDRRVFTMWKYKNELPELLDFLKDNIRNKDWHISYNGLAFDAQITHFILDKEAMLMGFNDGEKVARTIYAFAQEIITVRDRGEFLPYNPRTMKIGQLDVFKMNHWDNPAKSSSLKWIQYSMDWFNIEEMPIHHTTEITSNKQIAMIESYCINDVRSTKEIFLISAEQVQLRQQLTKEYKINLLSASEPRISKELFGLFLSKKLQIKLSELKQMRTPRASITLAECILPYVFFKTMEMKALYKFMQSKVITETKGALDFKVHYKGVDTYYGLGGIHGAARPGVYEAKPGWTIMTSDVTSFYPNLAIRNGFHPEHLPKKEFLDLYEWFFEERKKIPKKDPRNYVYKIILNSTYGLSNDENSFLYDPKFTMQITINGQLQLSMLYEMLAEGIPGAVPLMQNTDGLEMMIPEAYKDKYLDICHEWEQICKLDLEHDEYSKLILADVNNYIAVHKEREVSEDVWTKMKRENLSYVFREDNGHYYYQAVKCKGRFEWEPQHHKKVAILHKNKSFLCIPKAVYNYFVKGMVPEQSLQENDNIYDFCGGLKAKGTWYFEERFAKDGDVFTNKLNKIVRYYVSKSGVKLIKCNSKDGREMQVNAGSWYQATCNNILTAPQTVDQMDIDEEFYLTSIYKEISTIDTSVTRKYTQLNIF